MIVDIHSHLGTDYVFDDEQNEGALIKAYNKYEINKVIVQPFTVRPYIEDTIKAHDRIYRLCKKYPKKFFGMVSMNPHFNNSDYEEEIVRCKKELGFIGIKISTIAHSVNPSSKDGLFVFEVAEKLGLPIMIHTGLGTPFADPINSLPAIDMFPKVKVILAHSGSSFMFKQAMFIAKKCNNVFLDTSWLPGPFVTEIIDSVGIEKLMFASDLLSNIPIEIKKYEMIINNKKDFKKVMAENALKVFRLE